MRTRIARSALAICCLIRGATAANAQLLVAPAHGGHFVSLPASQSWGKTPEKDVTFPLHYHARVRPDAILVGRDHPNGTRFLALFPHDGVPLPLQFGKKFSGFDEFGELKPGYTVEIAEHRFARGSGEPELVIAVGNGRNDLAVNVLRYHAPRRASDAARAANWTLEGSIQGETKAILEDDIIWIPLGANQDSIKMYTYHQGKFD